MSVLGCVLGTLIVGILYAYLKKRRAKKNAELSGGFDKFADTYFSESTFLRILILEELERYQQVGYMLVAKKTRRKQIIITTAFIIWNYVMIMNGYYRSGITAECTVAALLYTFLMYLCDPIKEICKAVKNQPDREISQVVLEMMDDRPRKVLKPVGIGAFVLSLVLFFFINASDRFSYLPAEDGYCVQNYRPGIFSQLEQINIPEYYQDEPVVAIGKNAFMDIAVRRVIIPETVTFIDSYAFKDCSQLEQIKLPEGLRTLNGESFKGCSSLTEIVIPKGVTEIRGNTFEDCRSLKTVVLHDGIVDIHAYAFRNCEELKQIRLPLNISEIHANTFEGCESLQEIEIPRGVTRIAAHAFNQCTSLEYVFVPDSLMEIGSSAFRECTSLKTIELPEGVIIDERAFKDSPTRLVKKKFSDEQIDQISAEAREKEPDTLYYVYKKDAPNTVRGWDSVTILLVDDILFEANIEQDEAMQAMNGYGEVLNYLEAAEKAGYTQVLYGIYSPLASEIVGEPYFVSYETTVAEMMEECRSGIAEGEND